MSFHPFYDFLPVDTQTLAYSSICLFSESNLRIPRKMGQKKRNARTTYLENLRSRSQRTILAVVVIIIKIHTVHTSVVHKNVQVFHLGVLRRDRTKPVQFGNVFRVDPVKSSSCDATTPITFGTDKSYRSSSYDLY